MKRKIPFGEWDRAVLNSLAAKYAPAAVKMLDGMTLEAYAGAVPPGWNGETVELFDCFEMRRLQRHHPEIYDNAEAARTA